MDTMDLRAVAAIDQLGRRLPLRETAPRERKDRYVGMFYFLWLSQEGTDGPYNIEEILTKDPTAPYDFNHPLWGPVATMHHWGEALYGYYFTRDEWVMRKHIEMLAIAGVDFLVFDTTNRCTYLDEATQLMRLLHEYGDAGFRVPQVAFYTNTKSGETIDELYHSLYEKNVCPDTWFRWEGKPLMIGVREECCEAAQKFFTFRAAQWPFDPQRQGGFPWMEFIRPQRVYRDQNGEKEVMNVSVAQHPQCAQGDSAMYGETANWGRSYHDGHPDGRFRAVDWGFNFQEQWDYAIRQDPKIIFVTGWNEWIAGRWDFDRTHGSAYSLTNDEGDTVNWKFPPYFDRPNVFVDCCTEEYSRDIEPMRGGYFDNYYMQLVHNIRMFKGVPDIPVDGTRAALALSDEKWQAGVQYLDYPFGNAHRSCRGYGRNVYTNDTGINDIRAMRVASDERNLYFSVICAAPIERHGNWLRLYLNPTGDSRRGFWGYEYLANACPLEQNTTMLSAYQNGEFQPVRELAMRVNGAEMRLIIPKKALGIPEGNEPFDLEFKWADQVKGDGTIEDFYENGDTAPFGRFNYVYRAR